MALRVAGDFDTSYAQDMATLRQPWHWWVLVGGLGLLALLPQVAGSYLLGILNTIAITIITVQGLNILTGYAGQISLGQAAFMTVGGYISALLVSRLGLSFFVALPLAGLGAGLVGLLFGLPSLRVKGFYLAMATLAAQFIIPWFVRNAYKDVLNGAQGLTVPVPELAGLRFDTPNSYFYITLVAVCISTYVAHNIGRSRLGRALISIRDNDLAAEVLGINPFKYKLQAFFISAFYAGVAGALWAHYTRHINSETFDLIDSVWFLGMVVIGGLGTSNGPIFGAVFVRLLREAVVLISPALGRLFPALEANILAALGPVVFGTALMLFLIFEPHGLAHRWQVLKAAWRLRPFAH